MLKADFLKKLTAVINQFDEKDFRKLVQQNGPVGPNQTPVALQKLGTFVNTQLNNDFVELARKALIAMASGPHSVRADNVLQKPNLDKRVGPQANRQFEPVEWLQDQDFANPEVNQAFEQYQDSVTNTQSSEKEKLANYNQLKLRLAAQMKQKPKLEEQLQYTPTVKPRPPGG
jgi:hypothetical protein